MDNPFRTPVEDMETSVSEKERRVLNVGYAVVRFETKRLGYNAFLLGTTLVCWAVFPRIAQLESELLFGKILGGCIGANLAYSLGTVATAYVAYLGWHDRAASWVFFVCGTLVSIPLTWIVLSG